VSPDNRQHRGPHPADNRLFAEANLPTLRVATAELSWLLSHGYQMKSALKLVGDRQRLTERQRQAISRAACSDESLERRKNHCVRLETIENKRVLLDGFNLMITVEAGLSGGPLLLCRDESVRDLSSVHGSYRSVDETERAICLIGEQLQNLTPALVVWLLDRPISNSGRLAQKIVDIASQHRWPWEVKVVFNPDAEMVSSQGVAITSDAGILDRVESWANFKSHLIRQCLPDAWVIDLRGAEV
jgi:hypothetical protein